MSSFLYASVARGQASMQPDAINQNAGTFAPVVDAGTAVTDVTTLQTQVGVVSTDAATLLTQYGSIQASLTTLISTIGSGTGSLQAQALLALVNTGSTDLATLDTAIATAVTDATTAVTAAEAVVTDLDNLGDVNVVVNLNKGQTRLDVKRAADAIEHWVQDGRSLLNFYIGM